MGSRVRLACNATHWRDDSVSLVLWFRGGPSSSASAASSLPVYTIDARQRPLSAGARHLVSDALRGRARFAAPNDSAPYLELAPLEADDQAEYRCRVDYRSRPRENFLIILFVLGEFSWRRLAGSLGSPQRTDKLPATSTDTPPPLGNTHTRAHAQFRRVPSR